jgi:hypothetical protein
MKCIKARIMNFSLIANSGIQFLSKEIEINLNDGFKQVFYEWFDEDQVEQVLEYAYEIKQLGEFVRMSDLLKYGFIDHSGNLLVEPNVIAANPEVRTIHKGDISWITPKDYVYVALVGARKLLGRDVVKKALIDEVKLPVSLFATLFPNIPAAHIEDMLCIYKTYFVTGGACKKFPSASSNGACASSASTHRRPTSCSGGGICGSNSNP